MQHRIFEPILFQLLDGKSFEKFFLSFEIGLEGGEQQALPEAARAAKETRYAGLCQTKYKCRLIYIHESFGTEFFEALYPYRELAELINGCVHNNHFFLYYQCYGQR